MKFEKYKDDLDFLIKKGDILEKCMQFELNIIKLSELSEDEQKIVKGYQFRSKYQVWYSESLHIIKVLLPNRLDDFISYYKKPKNRKQLEVDNYSVEDYLQGTHSIRVGLETVAGLFFQQRNILEACKVRFESSLFDIKHLLQADIFDSELEAAKELNKKGFTRGAGAMVGVVLEAHFAEVCRSRNIKISKTHPTINDYNEALKLNSVVSIEVFRHIQLLGDLRNKCDHKKATEPTMQEITDLISGAEKIIKTVF